MTQDQNKKTLRHFQCRDYLWDVFEQMSRELECSTDYLINEAMRQYARSRNYGTRSGAQANQPGVPPSNGAPQIPPLRNPAGGPPGAGYPQQGGFNGGMPPLPGQPQQMGAPPNMPPGMGQGGMMPSQGMPGAPQAQPQGYPGQSPYPQPGGYGGPGYGQPPAQPAVGPQPGGYGGPPGYGGAPSPSAPGSYPQPGPPAMPGPPPAMPGAPPPLPGHPPAGAGYGATGQMPTLFIIFNGQKIPVSKQEFVIGRGSKTADLPIKDGNISRRHAAIVWEHGQFVMKDLGSTNGIEFGGQRIDNRPIQEGDVFQLCDYELRFTYR